MIFRIDLTVTNPMAASNRVLTYQFDPTNMTAAKWAAAYNTVKGKIDELVADAGTNPQEPPVW